MLAIWCVKKDKYPSAWLG